MNRDNSRREFLSQSGKMVTAAALFGGAVPAAYAANSQTPASTCENKSINRIVNNHYYLDNVLLESGFEYENGVAVHTRTEHKLWRFATAK